MSAAPGLTGDRTQPTPGADRALLATTSLPRSVGPAPAVPPRLRPSLCHEISMTFTIDERPSGSGAHCRAILATIGDWFGMPASNAEYEALAEAGPAVLALDGHHVVGLMLLKRHFATTLEVYFIGVDRS